MRSSFPGLIAALSLLVGCVNADAPLHPDDPSEFVFEVPKGSTGNKLAPRLVEAGLVSAEWQWKWFLRQEGGQCIKAGRFRLKHSMTPREVRDALCGPPMPEDVPFTVVEGWRIRDVDAALTAKGLIHAGEYAAIAENKKAAAPFEVASTTFEGYLYPETYMVTPDRFSVEKLVERQLAMFNDRFLSKHAADLEPRGLNAVVVMASMLEREEPNPKNRPMVAGILWKRLDNQWNLGVDATSRYALDEWNDRTAFMKRLRDPNDPYNTRLRPGLPPTAIGNPTVQSLEAALSPVASEFWYYLHDAEHNFHGGRDVAEHEANRKKYDVY